MEEELNARPIRAERIQAEAIAAERSAERETKRQQWAMMHGNDLPTEEPP